MDTIVRITETTERTTRLELRDPNLGRATVVLTDDPNPIGRGADQFTCCLLTMPVPRRTSECLSREEAIALADALYDMAGAR